MTGLFVDAGAWVALFNRRDRRHEHASDFYRAQRGLRRGLHTTNLIVAEAATRLRHDAGLAPALLLRDAVRELIEAGRLRLAWLDAAMTEQGWALMEQYGDLRLSLADATSAVVARKHRITDFFTFDSDFRVLGFEVQPVV